MPIWTYIRFEPNRPSCLERSSSTLPKLGWKLNGNYTQLHATQKESQFQFNFTSVIPA